MLSTPDEVREFQESVNRCAQAHGVVPLEVDGELGEDTLEAFQSVAWILGLQDQHFWRGPTDRAVEVLANPDARDPHELGRAVDRARRIGPPLSHEEIALGIAALELRDEWSSWIYRRVHSLSVHENLRAFSRRTSVDCDAGRALSAPDAWKLGTSRILPLTFISKWQITNFDLRDERNGGLPLATKRQHASIAAAMLLCMAYLVVEGRPPLVSPRIIPRELEEDFRAIAFEEPSIALRVWSALGQTRTATRDVAEWRDQLVSSIRFVELAFDISQSFPMAVVIPHSMDVRRRILKFSYDASIRGGVARRGQAHPAPVTSTREVVAPRNLPAGGAGHIKVRINVQPLPRDEPQPPPTPPVTAVKVKHLASQEVRRYSWEPAGPTYVTNLPPGEYECSVELADNYTMPGTNCCSVTVKEKEWKSVEFNVKEQRVQRYVRRSIGDDAPPLTWQVRAARSAALRSHMVTVEQPLAEGGSLHVDMSAPSLMQLTRAKLVAGDGAILDVVMESVQSAHLYLPDDRRHEGIGYVQVNVRPAPTSIVRTATVTACLAAALLLLLAGKWWITGEGLPAAAAALALAVPGGFSAYAAQSGNATTDEAFGGLRVLALLPGILCLFGAVAVVATSQHSTTGRLEVTIMALMATAVAGILAAAKWWAERPPEQRWTAKAQGSRFVERYGTEPTGG